MLEKHAKLTKIILVLAGIFVSTRIIDPSTRTKQGFMPVYGRHRSQLLSNIQTRMALWAELVDKDVYLLCVNVLWVLQGNVSFTERFLVQRGLQSKPVLSLWDSKHYIRLNEDYRALQETSKTCNKKFFSCRAAVFQRWGLRILRWQSLRLLEYGRRVRVHLP